MNAPDQGIGSNSPFPAIATYAERLREQLTDTLREDIRQRLLDVSNTQAEVADWLIDELNLSSDHVSSSRRLMNELVIELLTDEERASRRQHMQERNAAEAHKTIYDRTACGRLGGDIRMKQMREKGVNPAGHALWTDADKARLRRLLEDESNYRIDNDGDLKPIGMQIIELFNAGRNGSAKTPASIRSQFRRMLKQMAAEDEQAKINIGSKPEKPDPTEDHEHVERSIA